MSPTERNNYYDTRQGLRVLWLGVLAGPVLWFANQQLLVLLSYWVCPDGHVSVLHAVTAACFAGALVAGFVALKHWRTLQARSGEQGSSHQRSSFMAIVGVLTSFLFALVILAHAIPTLLIDPCWR